MRFDLLAWLLMTAAEATSGLSTRWMLAGIGSSPPGLACSEGGPESLGMANGGTFAMPAGVTASTASRGVRGGKPSRTASSR